MVTARMTHHASAERAERLAWIAENIGVGTIQYKFERKDKKLDCITSTGVLIVMDSTGKTIITAFCPNHNKIYAIFKSHGYERVPVLIKGRVERNIKIMKKCGLTFQSSHVIIITEEKKRGSNQ